MPNAWVSHIKTWARQNGKSYGCAMTDPRCKASYKAPAASQSKARFQTQLLSKNPDYVPPPKQGKSKFRILPELKRK